MSETKEKEGSGPIWNEAILFDIIDPFQPIIIELVSIDAFGREV